MRSGISGFKRRLGFVCVVPLLLVGMYQTHVFGAKAGKAPVEKTGQITSYSDTGGEDGDLKKGVKWPEPRFKDNGNGTVTDNLTKLIWLKNANAFGQKTWEQALAIANGLASGSAGLHDGSHAGDWRLPNVKELHSLIDFEYDSPALSNVKGSDQWSNGDSFSDVQSLEYWTSTTRAINLPDPTHAWFVNLSKGHVMNHLKTNTYYVWPVRGGR